MTAPWHDSDRVVAADSWFMGVNTIESFKKEVGLNPSPLLPHPLPPSSLTLSLNHRPP